MLTGQAKKDYQRAWIKDKRDKAKNKTRQAPQSTNSVEPVVVEPVVVEPVVVEPVAIPIIDKQRAGLMGGYMDSDAATLKRMKADMPHPAGMPQVEIAAANAEVRSYIDRHSIKHLAEHKLFVPCWKYKAVNA